MQSDFYLFFSSFSLFLFSKKKAALAQHPDVGMVSFTGSSATGGKILAACGTNKIAKPHLELGGKSAIVVCADTKISAAVETVLKGFMCNGGQICSAHSRLVIHNSIKNEVLQQLKQKLEELVATKAYCYNPVSETDRGDRAWEDGCTDVIQSIVCQKQYDMVLNFLAKAEEDGLNNFLEVPSFPEPEGKEGTAHNGFFVNPHIFVDVAQDSDLWQKEVFGPVLSVRGFETEEEAIQEANSTRFGLAATVMTSDRGIGERIGSKLRAGTVFVSSTGEGILCEFPGVQRGGYGLSGVGRELGIGGFHEFTELKSVGYVGFD